MEFSGKTEVWDVGCGTVHIRRPSYELGLILAQLVQIPVAWKRLFGLFGEVQ